MLSINNGDDIIEFRWVEGNGIVYVSIKNNVNMPIGGFVISDKIDCVFTPDGDGIKNLKPKALSILTHDCMHNTSCFEWQDIVDKIKSFGGSVIGSDGVTYKLGFYDHKNIMIVKENEYGFPIARTENFYKQVDIDNDEFMKPILDVFKV